MTDREKVIRGLKAHCKVWDEVDCIKNPDICPYRRGVKPGCTAALAADALALLKEQEPRVLSEEEVRERLGTFVWVEICSPHADCSMCLVFGKVYEDPAYPDLVTIREDSGVAWGRRWEDYGAGCWRGIRSGWRCWTARPTEEQRKAVAWNG